MKKSLTQLLGSAMAAMLVLAFAFTAKAQDGTQNSDFLFRVVTSAGTSDYRNEACGFGDSRFGPGIDKELCGEIVWAFDETPDSLVCDTIITQDLTGKIALVRRGTCNFSLKVWYCQQAGAKAVVVANHYATATDDGCSVIDMAAGTNAALDTIPSIFVCRNIAEEIGNALAAGETVNVCFLLPRFYDAAGPYHYSTPLSQVDSLLNMGVRYVNRTNATQEDVVLKAEITEPGGNVVTLTTTVDTVAVGESTFQYFPGYLPPAVVGEFNVLYTNNKYTEPRDSLRHKFVQTPYTFATDNLVNDPGGVGTTNANFISGGFVHQEGAICITGPNGGNATYVTFGVSNRDSVFVPNVPPGGTANDINIFVYDGDVDEDGTIDLSSSFDDLTQVGYGVYTMDGTETDGVLIDVPVADLVTGQPIELKPRHVYYVSLYYNGLEAGYGRDIRFANSLEEWFYLNFPSTPLAIGNGTALTFFNGGWDGADVVNRLQLDGYQPGSSVKPNVLEEAQVTVTPNPAVDQLRVNVNLNEASDLVTLTLFDNQGRMVQTQKTANFEDGQITMNVNNVASGMYLLWVRTAEGSAMRKVAICH